MKPSWLFVILVSFLVSSLIIAGFVIAKLLVVNESVVVLSDPPSPFSAEDVEDMAASDLTEFVSRALPITFSYPSDWQIWEGTTPLSDYIQIADYESTTADAFADTVPGHKLEITVLTQPTELTLKKWIKQSDKESVGIVGTIEDLMIDGFPAKLDYQVVGYSTFGTVYIPLGDGTDRVLMLSLYGPEKNFDELRSLFDSILVTVNITEGGEGGI